MDFSSLTSFAQNKTRIAVLANEELSKILLHNISFAGKEVNYISNEEITNENESDFVLIRTSDVLIAARFEPSIVLISSQIASQDLSPLLNSMTSGGVVIYPESLDLPPANIYSRKLPFSTDQFLENNGNYFIETEMGEIPLNIKNPEIIQDIFGLQLFVQQLGIMEDEFYDAIASYS